MRKRFLALTLSACMMASVVGCGSSAESTETGAETTTSTSAETQQESTVAAETEAAAETTGDVEQVLNIYKYEPTTLDRTASTIDEAGKFFLYDISEPLFRIEDGVTTPAGCESYTYDEDSMTYTFTLRENYWEDGVAVTAADYLYSFQRMVDPDSAYGYVSDLYCIKNAEAINAGEMEVSELGVTAPDDKTLVVQLTEATPAFLEVVPMYPMRQDFVESCGDSYGIDADQFLSCGPFVLSSWEHNSSIVLTKNENYWDADNVQLTTINVALTTDSNTQYTMMLNGTLDYMSTSTSEYIDAFTASDEFSVSDSVTANVAFMVLNCEDELLSNVKVRQALSLAFDRETFTSVLSNGLNQPAYGFISSAIGINGTSLRDVVEEPLKALSEEYPDPKELLIEGLTELGMDPDPSQVEITISMGSTGSGADNQMALMQQFYTETLGITVIPDETEWATFWTDCKAGDTQIGYLSWSGEVDISFLFNLFLSDSAQMPCFYYTSEYDDIVNEANKSTDADTRFELYGQAEKMICVDNCQVIPVYYTVQKAVLRNTVKGWDYNVFSTAGHKGVYIEG